MNESNDLLKLIDQHRFHNPLMPKVCHLCRVETRRQSNTPEAMWSKALIRVLKPPMPIALMELAIVLLTAALALTI